MKKMKMEDFKEAVVTRPLDFKIDSKMIEELDLFKDEYCLIQRFFEEQAKLPPSIRSKAAYISCPCKRCNPYTL